MKESGEPAPGVRIFLRREGAEVPEHLRAAARPVTTPQEANIDSAREALVHDTRTDTEGRYAFRVPPGKYGVSGAGTDTSSAVHSRRGWPVVVTGEEDVRVDLKFMKDHLEWGGVTASLVKANQGEAFEVAPMRATTCVFCHLPAQ